MMRAAQCDRYGSSDVIRVEEVPIPTPAKDQIRVRVRAATVSRTDCALLAARPFILRFMTGLFRPKLKTLGTDFAGEIDAVGANIQGFAVGDRVFGINDLGIGSHAQYLVTTLNDGIAKMPEGVSFETAAASLEGGWYAYSLLRRVGNVGSGTRVLVNGATGAIGSALLQFCVHDEAIVTAVGNSKNLDLLKSLGAHEVIDYEQSDFTRVAHPVTYDGVFDTVGKSTFGASKHLLVSGGIYSSAELGPGLQNIFLAMTTPPFGGKKVVFPLPVSKGEYLANLPSFLEEGSFRPVIDRVVTLDEICDAYTYADSGKKTGNVILTP